MGLCFPGFERYTTYIYLKQHRQICNMGSGAKFLILESVCLVLILNNLVSSFKSNVYLLWNTLDNMNKEKKPIAFLKGLLLMLRIGSTFQFSVCVCLSMVYMYLCIPMHA